MKKLLDIIDIIIILIIFLGGLVTEQWHFCYIALLLYIADLLGDIKEK